MSQKPCPSPSESRCHHPPPTGTPTFLPNSGGIFASSNKMKTFLLNFSVQTLDRKEKQEIDGDRSFSINYKISVNIAWNHCPVLINASLLCKHLSANLEALNKTSHEAPQGWLDREPPQEPRQLFLGTWDSPTGQGSEAHHVQGWRPGLWDPRPITFRGGDQDSVILTHHSCSALHGEDFQFMLGACSFPLTEHLSAVPLKWLHSRDSRRKSHSPLPRVATVKGRTCWAPAV